MEWNGLEWVGMALGIQQNKLGIRRNGRFQPFRWIPDGIPWNSNIPVLVPQIPLELMEEGKVLQSEASQAKECVIASIED